ncbi:MAG: N-acetyltransferase [Planctomycetota bacterium]|nr:MAG: N-acetyltransferase [Planctomycetota bacterium]
MELVARSERLSLVAPSMEHLDALCAMWSDAETMRYVGKGLAWTREEVAARIERAMKSHAERGMAFWTIVRNGDGVVLGQGGVVPIEFDGPEIELGYRLGRAHWGRGYATEAAGLTRDHAFGALGVGRLVAVTYPENVASRRVLAKVGFRETGESDKYYGVHAITFEMTPADLPERAGVAGA